jgi:hypothetical protein
MEFVAISLQAFTLKKCHSFNQYLDMQSAWSNCKNVEKYIHTNIGLIIWRAFLLKLNRVKAKTFNYIVVGSLLMASSSSIFVLSFWVLKLDWKDELRSRANNNKVSIIYIAIYTSWISQADKERAPTTRAALSWFCFKLLPYHEAGGRGSRLAISCQNKLVLEQCSVFKTMDSIDYAYYRLDSFPK